MRWILGLLFLTSCFGGVGLIEAPIVQGPSVKKQRQKIAVLQKKLEMAEKEERKVQEEMARLATEIDQTHLSLIRKQIDKVEHEGAFSDPSSLFLQEREVLHQMIEGGPSPSAFEAQVELDRILRIITELSDGVPF